MDNRINLRTLTKRFEENHLPFGVLTLQDGACVVISRRGGRIFGPFWDETSPSLLWVNNAFVSSEAFSSFLNSGDWNLGGERVWIAPEVMYNISDRSDFDGSYDLPPQLDPGSYVLEECSGGEWKLWQRLTLNAYNLSTGQKELLLERQIRTAENPLHNLSSYKNLMQDVRYAGYHQQISLREFCTDDKQSEVWLLNQLNPGGQLIIPASPCLEYSDYREPVDSSLQSYDGRHVSLKITGDRQYKVGYKAAHVTGRLAYYNKLIEGQAYLFVRNFYNNPSAPYIEEPAHLPGHCGHSVHVYNDDGALGGFGELECQGQAIGGKTGRSSSSDPFTAWYFMGEPLRIREIAWHLLGWEQKI